MIIGQNYRRWLKMGFLLIVLGALLLPSIFVQAQSPGNQSTPYLTWSDAPITQPMRHDGDAQVRWGLETADKVLGPFFHEPFQVGDRTTFNLGETSADEYEFELLYRSEHAYFWFEIGNTMDEDELKATAERFDTEFWELIRYIYGENATPGIDGDTRIHIVNMEQYLAGLAGFFSPDDQCARDICDGSNERDVIYLMMDYGPFGSDRYFGTLVHEFQHMIQFNVDGNEYRWMNEGLSQLAEHLSGYSDDPINADNLSAYLSNPNHPLNLWTYNGGGQAAYYGAGYLMNVYLYDRFGIEFIQALTQNEHDGLAGIQNTLEITGQEISLDEVIRDWWIANYVDDPYVDKGDYYYQTLDLPQLPETIFVNWRDGGADHRGLLQQYGADYLEINQAGTYTLDFTGDAETPIVLTSTHSNDWMWWSYNAPGTATTLTYSVNLSEVDDATLKYWIWGETGDFPGYLHVLGSTDGIHWNPITGVNMQDFNRFSEAPGPHHAGRLDGWQADFISLSEFAGDEVQIRFEYVTNNAVSGPGFVIDDISIPEIGWSDNVEDSDVDSDVEGFLRTQENVNQDWALVVIHKGDKNEVEIIPVEAGVASSEIEVGDDGAVILVGAMAPFTQVEAGYHLVLTPAN